MKKLASVSFAFLFLFNTFGYYFVYTYNRAVIQGEMKDCLKKGCFSKSYLTLIIESPVTNPDFKRTGPDEFSYRGSLYDIISEKQGDGCVIFTCINDKQEELLTATYNHFFNESVSQNHPAKAKHTQALLGHILKLALVNDYTQPVPPAFAVIHFTVNTEALRFSFPAAPSPPPKRS